MLIAVAGGIDEVAAKAMQVLDDPHRQFVTSDLVQLEVLPKATHRKKDAEVRFYEAFFQAPRRTVRTSRNLVSRAHDEACAVGLAAMDALHVAAAKAGTSAELITIERSTKPIFRVSGIAVKTLRPED